jgi:hypothetical protein
MSAVDKTLVNGSLTANSSQCGAHSLLHRHALDLEQTVLARATEVGKTKKVKRLGLALTLPLAVSDCEGSKSDQTGFRRIDGKTKLTTSSGRPNGVPSRQSR